MPDLEDNDIVYLTTEEAVERLEIIEDYDAGSGPGKCVHSLREGPFMLLGAHWYLDDVIKTFDQFGPQEAGPDATAANHGIVVIDDTGPVFFGTPHG